MKTEDCAFMTFRAGTLFFILCLAWALFGEPTTAGIVFIGGVWLVVVFAAAFFRESPLSIGRQILSVYAEGWQVFKKHLCA